MITLNVVTLFPQLFEEHLKNLPFRKAIEKGLAKVNLVDLRNFAVDKHGTVDSRPYGGGTGMLLMVEPVYNALEEIKKKNKNTKIMLLSPKGKKLTQEKIEKLAQEKNLTFVCGRYEGVDARIEGLCAESISIGDYVLSGGELPALVIMEGITRLLPGVLEKEDATKVESFAKDEINETGGRHLEYPQYTRPEDFKGKKVPEVLLSGNHAEIEKWRNKNRKRV
jgi:tRNA (guanine37-N1)-methyltransferase